MNYQYEDYDCDYDRSDRSDFADRGGVLALRRASKLNPRNLPCPTCGRPNKLTPAYQERGYQCNSCAARDELGG